MQTQLACSHCDCLIQVDSFNPRQRLRCPQCSTVVYEGHNKPKQKLFAFSLSAIISLILAVSFPFLTIRVSGQERTITLIETPIELYHQGFILLGSLVLLFILLVPIVYLLLAMSIVVFSSSAVSEKLNVDRGSFTGKWLTFAAKSLSRLRPWAMSEVFIAGCLVALIKVVELAELVIGVAFWAYACFAISFMFASIFADKLHVWQWVRESTLGTNKSSVNHSVNASPKSAESMP